LPDDPSVQSDPENLGKGAIGPETPRQTWGLHNGTAGWSRYCPGEGVGANGTIEYTHCFGHGAPGIGVRPVVVAMDSIQTEASATSMVLSWSPTACLLQAGEETRREALLANGFGAALLSLGQGDIAATCKEMAGRLLHVLTEPDVATLVRAAILCNHIGS
jgi:hypothetical protein